MREFHTTSLQQHFLLFKIPMFHLSVRVYNPAGFGIFILNILEIYATTSAHPLVRANYTIFPPSLPCPHLDCSKGIDQVRGCNKCMEVAFSAQPFVNLDFSDQTLININSAVPALCQFHPSQLG